MPLDAYCNVSTICNAACALVLGAVQYSIPSSYWEARLQAHSIEDKHYFPCFFPAEDYAWAMASTFGYTNAIGCLESVYDMLAF